MCAICHTLKELSVIGCFFSVTFRSWSYAWCSHCPMTMTQFRIRPDVPKQIWTRRLSLALKAAMPSRNQTALMMRWKHLDPLSSFFILICHSRDVDSFRTSCGITRDNTAVSKITESHVCGPRQYRKIGKSNNGNSVFLVKDMHCWAVLTYL